MTDVLDESADVAAVDPGAESLLADLRDSDAPNARRADHHDEPEPPAAVGSAGG
jgi:hypothetical protein